MEDLNNEKINYDIQIDYNSRISRLFIFRPLWRILIGLFVSIWMIPLCLIGLVHFLYKLILGRRMKWMWIREQRFVDYVIDWNLYTKSLIDERPYVIPRV